MGGYLAKERRVLDHGGKPTSVPLPPFALFRSYAQEKWMRMVEATEPSDQGLVRRISFSSLLDGFLVLDAEKGTLSRPEDTGIFEEWNPSDVRRRKALMGWVGRTRHDELLANYLGTRSFCYLEEEKPIWIVEKSHCRRARDNWLLGHILCFSTRSKLNGKMIGNLDSTELQELLEKDRETRRKSLGERRRGFMALGILLIISPSEEAEGSIRHLREVGMGGEGAESLKETVIKGALHEQGRSAGLVTWYCCGTEVWGKGGGIRQGRKWSMVPQIRSRRRFEAGNSQAWAGIMDKFTRAFVESKGARALVGATVLVYCTEPDNDYYQTKVLKVIKESPSNVEETFFELQRPEEREPFPASIYIMRLIQPSEGPQALRGKKVIAIEDDRDSDWEGKVSGSRKRRKPRYLQLARLIPSFGSESEKEEDQVDMRDLARRMEKLSLSDESKIKNMFQKIIQEVSAKCPAAGEEVESLLHLYEAPAWSRHIDLIVRAKMIQLNYKHFVTGKEEARAFICDADGLAQRYCDPIIPSPVKRFLQKTQLLSSVQALPKILKSWQQREYYAATR
ncbi:hypothetical protein CBR_g30596 [Chara braunii]|uniref:Uncharacterized protein n=1 Tax=Chara braunii TaxID=69332 RepID=A0A388LD53_CHABU|nr:hypothetical protein CBR_g30596 [Chara braunii]|eukprot:GBG80230.1 hypothetical protein CBR_g30596 [Chara braunii]